VHELLHGTIYIAGHAGFNESFANFVGHRGAIAFFDERGGQAEAARARDRWVDTLQFGALLAEILADLESAYARGITEEERQRRFEAARATYTARTWRTSDFDRFASEPLNNAVLLARHVYFDRLELFETVHRRFSGDLRQTIAWIARAARAGDEPYEAVRKALDPNT
jgi:predicted aminopeptidase